MTVSDPVLVLGFNRPQLLAQVFESLRLVAPERVFVAIDGPRPDRPGEAERVQQCRDLVAALDWGCEVRTLFQEVNLGCGLGVSTAITWFFDHVERGIILEDDILADPSFFPFCEELLDRYEDDPRVFAISGCNVVPRTRLARPEDPYRFSQIPLIWGWATWRRSWSKHSLRIKGWQRALPPSLLLRRAGYSASAALFWATEFELTARGDVDTWDWQLTLAAMAAGELTATSNVNLIQNIGFGPEATHTLHGSPRHAPPRPARNLRADVPVQVDRIADGWTTRHHFGGSTLTTLDRIRQYALRQREPRWE